jgi:hypothetical protein
MLKSLSHLKFTTIQGNSADYFQNILLKAFQDVAAWAREQLGTDGANIDKPRASCP